MTAERDDEELERRRDILRRAALYTYGMAAATAVIALGGAALIALFLRIPGLTYVEEWLLISAVVLIPSAFGLLIQRYHEHARRAQRPPDDEG